MTSNYMYLLDRGRIAVDNDCNGYVVFGDLVHKRIASRVRVGATSTDMNLSASGRTLLVATGRNLVGVDVRFGRVRHIFTAPFPIVWTATGPPGRFLAIGDTDTVGIIDAKSGRLRVIAHGDASVNLILDMLWTSPDDLLIETSGQTRGAGDLDPGLTVLDVVHGTRRTVSLPVSAHHLAALGS